MRDSTRSDQHTSNNEQQPGSKQQICRLDHHQWSFAPDCWGFGPSFHQAANTWKKRSGASALPLTEHQTSPRSGQIPRTLPETSFVQGFRNIFFPRICEWQWTSAFNVFILFHIDCFRPCTWCWMRMMWLGQLVEHRQDSLSKMIEFWPVLTGLRWIFCPWIWMPKPKAVIGDVKLPWKNSRGWWQSKSHVY